MTSGKPAPSIRIWLALLLWSGGAAASSFTLDGLLTGFAGVSAARARFTETVTLAILESPLTTTGTLSYRRPDYLKKQVEAPVPSLFEISGNVIVIETEQGRHTLSLNSQPLLRAFAEAYRATLAGDRAALEAHYRVELTGNAEHWVLRLLPIDDKLRERIQSIELSGAGPQILRIDTLETSGDRSLMTIVPDAT